MIQNIFLHDLFHKYVVLRFGLDAIDDIKKQVGTCPTSAKLQVKQHFYPDSRNWTFSEF